MAHSHCSGHADIVGTKVLLGPLYPIVLGCSHVLAGLVLHLFLLAFDYLIAAKSIEMLAYCPAGCDASRL